MTVRALTAVLACLVLTGSQAPVYGQQPLPPGFVRAPEGRPPVQAPKPAGQTQPPAAQPTAQQPAAQPAKPGEAPPTQIPAAPPPPGSLTIQNASLTEVIDLLARQLKINYILDPRVKGAVTINTYGETKTIDNRTLLDTILRINNAAMVQVGDIYRIVPLNDVQRLPLAPQMTNGTSIPEDDRTMLNLMFLKYAAVEEVAKLLDPFIGEGAKMWSYPPANLLMIQDSRRNMRRLMELISLFDNDAFTSSRVRLFEIKNGRPADVAKELESVFKSISLNEKVSPVKFLPVDRINTLIAVASNPGVFKEIENWLSKLDVSVESSSGSINNYVYRVRYGYAPTLAMAIMGLYSNNPFYAMQMMMMGNMMGGGMMGGGMGMGGMGMGGMGMGGMGGMYGGMGGMGMGGMGMGGMYGGGMMGGMGMMPGMMGGMYGGGMGAGYGTPSSTSMVAGQNAQQAAGTNLTGSYLGGAQVGGAQENRAPKIIPNLFDNSLLIQGTREEFDSITKLLRDLDIPPRQVLIEAQIYEVTLTDELANGVQAFLQQRGANTAPVATRALTGGVSGGSVLSIGALVGQSRELLVLMSSSDFTSKARIISAPSIIATDSVAATINVGDEVPTLTSQAVTGAQQNGSSLFANSVQSRNSGVTLAVIARVNPMGVVTLVINQEVSKPSAPSPDASIQSPSFSKRTMQTQVTLQDGDTIAIGGIISEERGSSSKGIPYLHRIPVLGAAFGSRIYTNARTELIIFMTPKVIYDMNNLNEASEDLKSRLKKLTKYIKE